jgi:threonine synthase
MNNISLGQFNTPLFRLFNLEKYLGWISEIWAKAEYMNPTGSFKDRGSVVEIKEAIRLKKKGIICASTGNMAASLSAYAAKVRLKCLIIVPDNTPSNKLKQALICGARLVKIKGNYDQCVLKAKELSIKDNLLLCGDYELRRIGQRPIGRELAESGIDLDAFVVPVGNGTLGCAIIEGFVEKNKWPRFIGVQGKGSDPLTEAWEKKQETFKAIKKPKTIASAMKVGNPLDGNLTLSWVRETNGMIVSVDDEEILDSQKLLAQKEGIYVETSAAATVSALLTNKIDKKLSVVLILTGNGLKENDV